MVIAAGPSWRQQPSPLSEDATPLIILLDVSESMTQTDIAPSRLERAKQKISDLLERVSEKRVALVVYAGSAHTVLPLTPDHDLVRNYLSSIKVDMMPRNGKFAEYALPSVAKVLGDTRTQPGLLLITDGLGTDTESLFAAWLKANPAQLTLYGIGRVEPEQSEIPLAKSQLESLAARTGADLVEVTVDQRDVETIVRRLEGQYVIIDDEALPWLDSGYWLVWPTLALALLWFRRGWTRVWSQLVAASILSYALSQSAPVLAQAAHDPGGLVTSNAFDEKSRETSASTPQATPWYEIAFDGFVSLWLTDQQYGYLLLEFGYFEKAANIFDDPIWQATARYYDEDFRQAAQLYSRRDSNINLFNEANAWAHRRDYLLALKKFDELLVRDSEFPGAQANRDVVQAIVDETQRLSESQAQEGDNSGSDLDPESDPRIAEGADQLTWEEKARQTFSADELLANPETAALWLKSVQQNPATFLSTKFTIQIEERGVSE